MGWVAYVVTELKENGHMDCKRFRNTIFVKILSLLIAVSFLFTSLDAAPLFAQTHNNPYLYKLSAPPIWRLLAEFRYAAGYLYKCCLAGKDISLDEINSTLEKFFEKKRTILEKEAWAEDALKYGGLEVINYGWHGDPILKELEIIFKFKNNSDKIFRAVYSGKEFKEVERIPSLQIKADSAKVKLPKPSEVPPKKQIGARLSQEEATGKLNALATIGSIERLTEFYKEVERKHLSYKEIFEHLKPELAKMVETLRSARQVDELNKLLEQKELNIQVKQLDILRAVSELILQFLPDKKGVDNIARLKEIKNVFVKHPDISKLLIDYFETRFDPNKSLGERGEDSGNIRIEILDRLEKISGNFNEYSILYLAQAIFVATVKTNYYIDDRISLFLRLIPRALVLQDRSKALIRTTPFAIIWVHVPYGVYGAHSRYADIARGGLRSLRPDRAYLRNKVLSECTALSFTQHNKHIDIPEGGSKGTFIYQEGLNPIAAAIGYVDGLMGSMMSNEKIVAAADIQYHPVDPLELGPDEGTAELGSLFTVYGWMKGLEEWSLLMTGKLEALFGVSHMENNLLVPARKGNRVTSQGVMVHAIEMIRYLRDIGKIKSEDTKPVRFSVTGGPRGDVTSGIMEGAIHHYGDNAKILTLGDSSGVIVDFEGLDNKTLLRMYDEKAQCKKFPRDKLHKGGFVVEVKEGGAKDSYVELGPETLMHMNTRALDPDELKRLGADIRFREQAKLKSNEPLVEVLDRDEKGHPKRVRVHSAYLRDAIFFLVKSDMLLTGGGMKDSIDDKNWQLFFDWDGSPIAPGIVHGANVFISRIANNELESRGVIIEPDEKANSIGVEISSRMEVDFNILFDIEEIKHELMAAYFEQVISKSLENAKEKFWALRIEAEDNPGKHIVTNISPRMSEDIIRLADLIKGSHLVADRKEGYTDTALSYLKDYFPDVSRLDPGRYKRTLDRVFDRMSSDRIKAIASKVIAKEVVLNLGTGAISQIARITRKSDLEIIKKYLEVAQELNINNKIQKVLDNKESLSPREQISRLRALRQETIAAITPPIAGGLEDQSGVMPREGEQDVHKWWREAGFTEEEIYDLGEKWDETWREAREDTKKFKEIERELKEHNIIIKKLAELSSTENPLFASYQSLTKSTANRFKSDEPSPFTEAEGSLLTDTDKNKLINSRKEYLKDPKFEHLLPATLLYAKLHDKMSSGVKTPPSSEIRTVITKDNADQFIETMRAKLENVESELIQKHVWIIMKGKFELDYRGNDAATEKYKRMIQGLRTIEGNGGNVTFVKDKVSMINVMKIKILDDYKVVVIDDNPEDALTGKDLSGLEEFKNQYAVIQAEVRRQLEADEFQYFNIKAMVALGLAMIDENKDEDRIKELYNLLTGEDIKDDKLKDIKASNIVRLLPRIVKFSGELDTYTIIRKLVEIAA